MIKRRTPRFQRTASIASVSWSYRAVFPNYYKDLSMTSSLVAIIVAVVLVLLVRGFAIVYGAGLKSSSAIHAAT